MCVTASKTQLACSKKKKKLYFSNNQAIVFLKCNNFYIKIIHSLSSSIFYKDVSWYSIHNKKAFISLLTISKKTPEELCNMLK